MTGVLHVCNHDPVNRLCNLHSTFDWFINIGIYEHFVESRRPGETSAMFVTPVDLRKLFEFVNIKNKKLFNLFSLKMLSE